MIWECKVLNRPIGIIRYHYSVQTKAIVKRTFPYVFNCRRDVYGTETRTALKGTFTYRS